MAVKIGGKKLARKLVFRQNWRENRFPGKIMWSKSAATTATTSRGCFVAADFSHDKSWLLVNSNGATATTFVVAVVAAEVPTATTFIATATTFVAAVASFCCSDWRWIFVRFGKTV